RSVRQAHSRDLGFATRGADPLHGEWRESPGERRILPTGDAEHEAARTRRTQVVDEEADTSCDLTGGVDLRLRTERLDDLPLQFPHGRILSSGEVPAYAADVTDGWRAQSVPRSNAAPSEATSIASSRASSAAVCSSTVPRICPATPDSSRPTRSPVGPPMSPCAAYCSRRERESAMSRLRIVSCPMRSSGPKAASPTRSIESFSAA